MADVTDISPDLDRLDSQLDNLEEALQPLLENLSGLSSQVPLLDKAKLFSLTAYSIESLLFASLKLQGTDAQSHQVYEELKRVQQYFGKIKNVETPAEDATRKTTINQEGLARILKAGLGDNKEIGSKLAEKIAEEKAKALLKSVEGGGKRKVDAVEAASASASAGEQAASKKTKKEHKGKGDKKKKKDKKSGKNG